MSALASPPSLESKIVQQSSSSCCLPGRLCKNALRVSGIFCLVLFMVCKVACMFGMFHPALIIGCIISLVLGLVLLILSARCREFKPSFPKGFLSIIHKEFPKIICELIVQEKLTLPELRAVISCLSTGTFTFPSTVCQEKVERFGLKRLQKACEGIQLPDLEKIILKNCPLYFLNKFIELGPEEFPKSMKLTPDVYWLSRLGLADSHTSCFSSHVWMLSQVVTEEEYETLLTHAKNSTWDQIQGLTKDIMLRLDSAIDECFVDGFGMTKGMLKSLGGPWLLYLCKHGVCWEQLQLIKELDCLHVSLLDTFDNSHRRCSLAKLYFSVAPHVVDESDSKVFDPSLALFTFNEWTDDFNTHVKYDTSFYKTTMRLLGKRSQHSLRGCREDYPELPQHGIDRITGAVEDYIP